MEEMFIISAFFLFKEERTVEKTVSKRNSAILSATQPARFLRLPQVLEIYPVGRTNWWAGVKSGRYPAAVRLTSRTVAWFSADIEDLVQRTRQGGAA